MAHDVRPFQSVSFALLCLAAVLFAGGVWGELRSPAADPVARIIGDTVVPLVHAGMPAFLPASETTFGTLANVGGVVALAGLVLFTFRRRMEPAATVPAMPRVVPRRPSDLRSARTAARTSAAPADVIASPAEAPAPPERGKKGRGLVMLVALVIAGLGGAFVLARQSLPVPAFTPPEVPSAMAAMVQPALVAVGLALVAMAVLRLLRRRRAAV